MLHHNTCNAYHTLVVLHNEFYTTPRIDRISYMDQLELYASFSWTTYRITKNHLQSIHSATNISITKGLCTGNTLLCRSGKFSSLLLLRLCTRQLDLNSLVCTSIPD